MKEGDIVQVWDDKKAECLGWGRIVAFGVGAKKGVPLIILEARDEQFVWGDEYFWLTKEKAIEISKRIFRDIIEREKDER